MDRAAFPKLRLPFVTTRITTDIVLFFCLLPLWMILGITQFLGPILMISLVFKLLILRSKQKGEIVIPFFPFSAMAAFLLSSLISGLNIKEDKWNLVFLRNFIVYAGALSLFLVVINIARNERDLLKIIRGLNVMVFIASLFGLAVVLGLIPIQPEMVAPVSRLLPESIRESEFFARVVHPGFGDTITLEIFNLRVKRINSIFPYANIYAAALIMVLPFQVFLLSISRGWRRILTLGNIFLVSLNVFFTYSRSALLALVFGFLGFRFLRGSRFLGFLKKPVILISLVVLLLLFFLVLRGPLLESKSWSTSVRSLIFEKSIESWKEKPVFGWGTDRNMEVVGESPRLPPLGSHFYYLTILYRYGLAGLILFAAIIGMILREIGKVSQLAGRAPFAGRLGLYAAWAFFMILIQAAFIVMDYDVVVLFLMWLNWGIIVAVRIMLEKREAVGKTDAGRKPMALGLTGEGGFSDAGS